MNESISHGSVWFTAKELGLREEEISSLVSSKQLFYCDGYYANPILARCENEIAKNVLRLLMSPHMQYDDGVLNALITDGEDLYGQVLHAQQRNSIKMACNNLFSVVIGGPGTGKTTTIKIMAYVLRRLYGSYGICFAAPTGRAARRIYESIGEDACTLHKMLGLSKQKEDPDFFPGHTLIVDECSMIDTELASKLFQALVIGKRIVLVGDIDQLPSIGAGAVLRDLVRSSVIPVTMLTHTFRQASCSGLLANITKIKKGATKLVQMDDFLLHCVDGISNKNLIHKIVNCYQEEVRTYGKENVIVLVPYRKSGMCSNLLNKEIQAHVNPGKGYAHNSLDNGWIDFRKGDFVMQLENRAECANGDVGLITEINESIAVKYTDCTVFYPPEEWDQIVLAYAMTIHKSQGSEYKSVITVLLDEHKTMLERNLLYTGVTRAKQKHTLFYNSNALIKSIQTKNSINRKTFLTEKLIFVREQYRLQMGA